jgi:hypothetical protein
MSDFLQPNRAFVYVNGSVVGKVAPGANDQEVRGFPNCVIKFTFHDSLLAKGNDYSVSLVRWECPMQLMAKVPAFPGAITVYNVANPGLPVLQYQLNLQQSYTMHECQQSIRAWCTDMGTDVNGEERIKLYLTPDMRWRMDISDAWRAQLEVRLSPAFQRWLCMARQVFTDLVPLAVDGRAVEFSYCSVADTYNRLRKITFSSSLFLAMEVSSGYGMSRVMTDFITPKTANLSYQLNRDGYPSADGTFTEHLPQTITFTAPPMSGRWTPITAPQPIYNFEVRATCMCFNWDTMEFTDEAIPLPLGAEFTCKLLFASRSEVPVVEG